MSIASGISTSRPRCLIEPIPEIFEAASYLKGAVSALRLRRTEEADALVRAADIPIIREWTEALWRSSDAWLVSSQAGGPFDLPGRAVQRMPDNATRRALIRRDGYHCRFCGVPLIRHQVRDQLKKLLPDAVRWGRSNSTQHTALQAMWLQYDHLLPHSRGGGNSPENIVITCAPCNYARMNYTIEEVGLDNPLSRPPVRSEWDGLENVLALRTFAPNDQVETL